MLLLSLCLKEFLISSGRVFQIRVNERRNESYTCSIVGILQGLSESSSRYANYIDSYYQQFVAQVKRGIQVP